MNLYRPGQSVKPGKDDMEPCSPLDSQCVGEVLDDTVEHRIVRLAGQQQLVRIDKGVPEGKLAPVWEKELC